MHQDGQVYLVVPVHAPTNGRHRRCRGRRRGGWCGETPGAQSARQILRTSVQLRG